MYFNLIALWVLHPECMHHFLAQWYYNRGMLDLYYQSLYTMSRKKENRCFIVLIFAMIRVADFRDLCLWALSPTFPVYCNRLNSVRATQTGLSRTCRKHLDMWRWFVSATFMICVGDFCRNFMISWFVTDWVHNFYDFCSRLSLRGSFSESRRNGIWALVSLTVHSPWSRFLLYVYSSVCCLDAISRCFPVF